MIVIVTLALMWIGGTLGIAIGLIWPTPKHRTEVI